MRNIDLTKFETTALRNLDIDAFRWRFETMPPAALFW